MILSKDVEKAIAKNQHLFLIFLKKTAILEENFIAK